MRYAAAAAAAAAAVSLWQQQQQPMQLAHFIAPGLLQQQSCLTDSCGCFLSLALPSA
jgi:hypothetical protein